MAKYSQIGERLKELRVKKLGISQEEFAKRVGISLSGYQNYEAGLRVPHPHKLTKIAEMCDTTVDWILRGELNVEKARHIEWLKRAYMMEEIAEKFEESIRREEKLLVMGAKEEAPKYGLDRLGQIRERDLIETLRSLIMETKIDLLRGEDRIVVDDLIEILKNGNSDIVAAIKANIKAFLGTTRAAKNKRAYPRILLSLPIEFQIMDQAESHPGETINGSQMGCLIQTSHDMPVETRIHLKMTLPGRAAGDSFRTKAEIMWKNKQRSDDTETYQYGLRFLEVLDEGHAKLDSLLHGLNKV